MERARLSAAIVAHCFRGVPDPKEQVAAERVHVDQQFFKRYVCTTLAEVKQAHVNNGVMDFRKYLYRFGSPRKC